MKKKKAQKKSASSPSQRGDNFTQAEEEALMETYQRLSRDAARNTKIKKSKLYDLVADDLHEQGFVRRPEASVRKKHQSIQASLHEFTALVRSAAAGRVVKKGSSSTSTQYRSGTVVEDDIADALATYESRAAKVRGSKKFPYLNVWRQFGFGNDPRYSGHALSVKGVHAQDLKPMTARDAARSKLKRKQVQEVAKTEKKLVDKKTETVSSSSGHLKSIDGSTTSYNRQTLARAVNNISQVVASTFSRKAKEETKTETFSKAEGILNTFNKLDGIQNENFSLRAERLQENLFGQLESLFQEQSVGTSTVILERSPRPAVRFQTYESQDDDFAPDDRDPNDDNADEQKADEENPVENEEQNLEDI